MSSPARAEGPVELWPGSGCRHLEVGPDGQLRVTDAYLRHLLDAPELAVVEESCPAERALSAALRADPRLPVDAARLADLADPDARENYAVALALRDLLLAEPSLEAAYWAVVSGRAAIAPALLPRLTQAILAHLLRDEADGLRLRAGEVLFRPQAVRADGGQVLLADLATLQRRGGPMALRRLQALIREAQGSQAGEAPPELDLAEADGAAYRARGERYDTVLDLTTGGPGARALAAVLDRWIRHFHGVATRTVPVPAFEGAWRWHIGLDAQASALLDRLYREGALDAGEQWRLIALFTLYFENPADAAPALGGRPVYLAAAMTEESKLFLKPQNLLVNLPLAAAM